MTGPMPPVPTIRMPYYDSRARAEAALRHTGYGPVVVNGEELWSISGLTMRSSSCGDGGIEWSHERLDVQVSDRCPHCHRFDIRKNPARSLDEAIERGYFVRLAAGVHYPAEMETQQ